MGNAPNCEWPGCNNTTWSPDRRCPVHRGKKFNGEQDESVDRSFGVPVTSQDASASSSEIHSNVKRAFPDISDRVHPESIREQSVNNLRAAVSIEVFRKFPDADLEDPDQRDAQLKHIHSYIVENALPTDVDMDDDTAEILSTATDDMYGSGYEDSVGLTSYGIRREWDLARSMNIENDRDGIPYGNSYDEYLESVDGKFQEEASNEYMRQVARFPHIVHSVSNRYPLSDRPIFQNQDMRPNVQRQAVRPKINYADESQYQTAQEYAREEQQRYHDQPQSTDPNEELKRKLIEEGSKLMSWVRDDSGQRAATKQAYTHADARLKQQQEEARQRRAVQRDARRSQKEQRQAKKDHKEIMNTMKVMKTDAKQSMKNRARHSRSWF